MIRRMLVVLSLMATALVGLGAPAMAATSTRHAITLAVQQHHAEVAQAVALLFGFLASHITAWTTHWSAPAKVKATVATVLAVVAGTVASIGWAPGQPWFDWVKAIVLAVIASQAGYLLRNLPVIGAANFQLGGLGLGKAPGATDTPPATPVVPNSAPLPEGYVPDGAP